MRWFTRGKTNEIRVAWQYTTGGKLWRLYPSASGRIVVEDRDVERKKVSFTCLDQMTGRVLWTDLQFAEKWWITIDSIYHDVLFLHEYATPDMPEHKKIHAVDVESGRLSWSN